MGACLQNHALAHTYPAQANTIKLNFFFVSIWWIKNYNNGINKKMIIVFTSGTSVGIFNFQVLEMTNLSRHFPILEFIRSHSPTNSRNNTFSHAYLKCRVAGMREVERERERESQRKGSLARVALTCMHPYWFRLKWCECVLVWSPMFLMRHCHVTLPHHQNSIRISSVSSSSSPCFFFLQCIRHVMEINIGTTNWKDDDNNEWTGKKNSAHFFFRGWSKAK